MLFCVLIMQCWNFKSLNCVANIIRMILFLMENNVFIKIFLLYRFIKSLEKRLRWLFYLANLGYIVIHFLIFYFLFWFFFIFLRKTARNLLFLFFNLGLDLLLV